MNVQTLLRRKAIAIRWLAFALVCATASWAKSITWAPDSAEQTQIELYLDPYYSALNYTHPLTNTPIERLDADAEDGLYGNLLRRLPFPRDILFEVSVNPLPVAGVAWRDQAPTSYRRATLGSTNLVQAATEGFPEPWAASLFFGNVVNLASANDSGHVHGIGYSGILLSYGNQHIVANQLVGDNWLEFEVKLKGEDIRSDRTLGWSFRLGAKEHGNDGVRDALYFAVKRSRTDFSDSRWCLLRNSSAEARIDVDQCSLNLLRYQLVVGKAFPFASGRYAATINLGVIRQKSPSYRGTLADLQPSGWQYVIRPNLEF